MNARSIAEFFGQKRKHCLNNLFINRRGCAVVKINSAKHNLILT